MLHRNRTILCAVLALLVLSLCACQAQSEHSGASASAPTSQETGDQIVSTQEVPCCALREPMEIRTTDRVYAEVDQATIRELGLAVASCDGLTELGKIKDAGQTVTRPVYEKWGEEPTLTEVTMPETAYAHPDPRYPNLAVALVDGAPAIFQFCSFIAPYDGDLKLEDVYGPLNADTVKSVSVSIRREVHGSYEPKPQVTDREAIAAFCDAFHAQYTLSDSELEEIAALHRRYNEWLPENAEGLEDAEIEAQRELHCGWLPEYLVDIELFNGFQVSLYYYPERFSYEYGMDGGLGSKQMNEWFDAWNTGDGSLCSSLPLSPLPQNERDDTLQKLSSVPEGETILAFDVSEQMGILLITRTETTNEKHICILNLDGDWIAAYSFDCAGSVGVAWEGSDICLFFTRGHVIEIINLEGRVKERFGLTKSSYEIDKLWNQLAHREEKSVNTGTYTLRTYGLFLIKGDHEYSQLVYTDCAEGEEIILYDASKTAMAKSLAKTVIVIVLFSVIIFSIIIQIKHNRNKA